jgi:hypothetical protein
MARAGNPDAPGRDLVTCVDKLETTADPMKPDAGDKARMGTSLMSVAVITVTPR